MRNRKSTIYITAALAVAAVSGGLPALAADRGSDPAKVEPLGLRTTPQRLVPAPSAASIAAAREKAQAEQAKAQTPQAQARRTASRSEFRDLGRDAAIRVAREHYPDVLGRARPMRPLPRGYQKIRHVGTHGLVAEDPDGRRVAVDSMLPLVATADDGRQAPVNLQLVEQNGAYEPANAVSDVRIAARTDGGFQLLRAGVTLIPVGGGGNALATNGTSVDGNAVVYPNTQTDADTIAKAVPLGLETNTILRSPRAPEQLRFRVDARAGSRLAEMPDGGVAITQGDRRLATVLPPVARDASGSNVTVTMRARGRLIVLSVEHRSADVQYPVDVDPIVTDRYPNNPSTSWPWTFLKSGSFTGSRNTFALNTNGAAAGEWAAWSYPAQGSARIYQFDPFSKIFGRAGLAHRQMGITDSSGGWVRWGGATAWVDYMPGPYACASFPDCSSSAGTPGNVAVSMVTALYNGSSFDTWLTGADVYIAQDTPISVSFAGDQPEWLRAGGLIPATASDQGIGVAGVKFTAAGLPTWSVNHNSTCASIQCPQNRTVSASANGLPEGTHTVTATATNALTTDTATRTVKVDKTPPTLALSGALKDAEGVALEERAYPLRVTVSDGDGATESSGVGGIDIWVDGTKEHSSSDGCSPGPCEATYDWTYDPARYGSGSHTIVVQARDTAAPQGNRATKTLEVISSGGAQADLGPGRVDLTTGDYTLHAVDAVLATRGDAISVGRTYGSRRTAGVDGLMGPSWRPVIGPSGADDWQLARELPNGDVELWNGEGPVAVATQSGGAFHAPPGYGVQSVEKVDDAFRVTVVDGTVFVLRQVDGQGDHVLSSIDEPGPVGATVLRYEQTADGVRPTRIIGPSPTGVTCSGALVRGCRALTLVYADSTSATGHGPSAWGDVEGQLKRIDATAFDPATSTMQTIAVAQYTYDGDGHLRATWDPRVSPPLKSTYGYDAAGRVTALTPPGEHTWILTYGRGPDDALSGRILDVRRRDAGAGDGGQLLPENTAAPEANANEARVRDPLSVSHGDWTHDPVGYGFEWSRCETDGTACEPLPGATKQTYVPQANDYGKALVARVSATNAGGTTTATTAPIPVTSSAIPQYEDTFGGYGTANGTFQQPSGAAVDADGNVWVADTTRRMIQKFDASGQFVQAIDLFLFAPQSIAINHDSGEIYVTATCSYSYSCYPQVVVLDSAGQIQRLFAVSQSPGSPYWYGEGTQNGLTVADDGNVWVAATAASRVIEFSPTGTKLREFPVTEPTGIALSGDNVLVSSQADAMVEVFTPDGDPVAQYDQIDTPAGLATTPTGAVYAIDTGYNTGEPRVHEITADGDRADVFTPEDPASWTTPIAIAVGPSGDTYTVDRDEAAIQRWSPPTGNASNPTPPAPPDTSNLAIWTVDYDVAFAPVKAGEVEAPALDWTRWGQQVAAVAATAIFEPHATPPATGVESYDKATVYYLDRFGNAVNVAAPGGRISSTEYDRHRNPTRILTAANRARALEAGSGSAAKAKLLDTQYTYSADGRQLQRVLGPERTVVLDNGTETQARQESRFTYDEGAPSSGGPYNLITATQVGALVTGQSTATDVRTTTTRYDGQDGLGWTLRKPTSVLTDPGGLNLVRTTLYDPITGAVTETRQPADPTGGDAGTTKLIPYSTDPNPDHASCGNRPEWEGLPCATGPAAQPTPAGLPDLPSRRQTYDLWHQPVMLTETTTVPEAEDEEPPSEPAGVHTRTSILTYDGAGRVVKRSITATHGAELGDVTYDYDPASGQLISESRTQDGSTRTLSRTYDSRGRLATYTDADGVTSTYTYDRAGRLTSLDDGKATQAFNYDPITGDLAEQVDSALGSSTAEYDAGGRIVREVLPGDVVVTTTYNAADQTTGLSYAKLTGCGTDCSWFEDAVVPSIHGQWRWRTNTHGTIRYGYDEAARLTTVQDTPADGSCTTRLYTYDANSNRTSSTSIPALGGGGCNADPLAGQTTGVGIDTADRLTAHGVVYDPFGNIKRLPEDLAGGAALSATYFADGLMATISQDGVDVTRQPDPSGRVRRETRDEGAGPSRIVSHFADSGDVPSWTSDTVGGWERIASSIMGIRSRSGTEGPAMVLIADLHGDVIGTAAPSETAVPHWTSKFEEFGVPEPGGSAEGAAWLGGYGRSTTLSSGVVSMGARVYVPHLGRFLQPDPVSGGSASPYDYANGDPVNSADLNGTYTVAAPDWLWDMLNETAVATVRAFEAAEAARRAAEAAATAAGAGAVPGAVETWGEVGWDPADASSSGASLRVRRQSEGGNGVAYVPCATISQIKYPTGNCKTRGIRLVSILDGACALGGGADGIKFLIKGKHLIHPGGMAVCGVYGAARFTGAID